MRVTTASLRWLLCALLLCLGVTACKPSQSDAKDEQPLSPAAEAAQRAASPASIGVSLRGYNFTYEGVQSFWVDGSYGANLPPYGGGGKESCCVRLPFAWHEGQTMTVKWTIGHYTLPWEQRKHMSIDEEHRCCWSERTLEKTVPVQRYDEPSVVQVFFLSNDELEIWVTIKHLRGKDAPAYALAGIPLRVQFLGLFDTVASAGMADASPFWRGFGGWANGTMDIPHCVERTVHYVAAHELRLAFPCSSTRLGPRKYPNNCLEVIYPGAHSDVGGGYNPGAQGKSRGGRKELLSQIPLTHMYREARLAGVPLQSESELRSSGQGATTLQDMQIAPETARLYDAYLRDCPVKADVAETMMKAHTQAYWRWREQVSNTGDKVAEKDRFNALASVTRASPQEKQDLIESEQDYRLDRKLMRDALAWAARPGYAEELNPVYLEIRDTLARPPLSKDVHDFFDTLVHDSHATFYMLGPTTALDRQMLYETLVEKKARGESLRKVEQRIVDGGRNFPVLTDADTKDLLAALDTKSRMALVVGAGQTTRRERGGHLHYRRVFRFRLLRLLGHALAIVIFLWLAGALALSFGNNRQYLGTIGQRAQTLAAQVRGLYAQFKPSAVPDVLSSARELPAYAGLDFADPPGSFLYGLYSVPPVRDASAATYASLQDHLLLPAILQRMETVLAQSVKDKDAKTAYETLRVYKLLHDRERYMSGGARDVRNWVLKDWEASDSAAVFGGRASMVGHVEALFSGDRSVQSASLPNEGLVREVQDFLNANTSTQRVYERAKAAMAPEAPQEFTLVRAVGPQVGTVLARADGQPLEKGVPGLFTYDGYHALFNKRLGEFVEKALEEDAWVMGRTGAASLAAAAQKKTLRGEAADSLRGNPLLEDIRRQYLTEYAQNWRTFLDSVRVVSSRDETNTSLGFDLSVLRQLAAPDSPLARLARAAARETTLSRPLVTSTREEDKSFLDKASDALDKKSRELGKNLGIRPEERLEKQLVDDTFAALREVVTGQPDIAMDGGAGAASAKPGLENISGLLNEYYTALVVADTALAAGSLPPGGPELGARLKLEAGKLPAPFREVLTALAVNGGDKVTLGATAILRKQAQQQFDRIMGLMAMQVSEPCKRGVEGRYPLAAVDQDASIEDFTAVFAAGGAADEFFNKYLAPFVDTSVRPWRYKDSSVANAMVGVEAVASGGTPAPATTGPTMLGELLKLLARSGPSLDAFYRAQQIREVFFRDAGGRKLSWKMDLRVLELEPSITDLVIDIDGQGLRYVHGPVQPFAVNWPGPRGGSMAELSANPRISGPTSTILQQGPWALFRLLEKGRIVQTATPGRLSVEYSFDGRKALIDIGTGSQPNPLNSDLLKGFRCPGRAG